MFKGARAAEYLKKIIFPSYLPEEQTDNLISPTVQNMNGIRSLMDTVTVGLYPSTTLPKAVEAGSNVRVIVNTAHGASRGDIIRFTSGAAIGLEIPILGVPDTNTMVLASTLPSTVAIADTFFVMKWVTPTYDSTGSLNVTATPYPLNSSETPVFLDPAGLTVAITAIKTLTAALKQIKVSNNSGNDLIITKNGTDMHLVPKGTNALAELSVIGIIGDVIGIRMRVGTGVTGATYFNFEG